MPAARGARARAAAADRRDRVRGGADGARVDAGRGRNGCSAAVGTTVDVRAWTLGADGRARYEVVAAEQAGWAAPGSVALTAADPLTRAVAGRPIVEPLRGKGMWYILDSREHGTAPAARIVGAARANGLTHLYVEVATSRGGFWGARWLDDLLPAARAAGLRVIGSVYPCLDDIAADLDLSVQVARYRTPDGLALDGLTADVEETLVAENVEAYGALLRQALGDDYLLVATVYPPESFFAPRYPWAALARSWNALAPMAYWRQMERRPFTASETAAFVQRNLTKLRALVGRDDLPVDMLGQTFDASAPRLLGPEYADGRRDHGRRARRARGRRAGDQLLRLDARHAGPVGGTGGLCVVARAEGNGARVPVSGGPAPARRSGCGGARGGPR